MAVNFHGLGTPHTAVAEDERPFWLPLERFEQILGRIARSPDPARFVVTFDDGNASDIMAADALARRG
ncbi:hypothetical protein GRI40_10535 [Altererythrobacter aerius]|uniref:Polysaccharide deacetylase family protein n=1 Tax=Tsuneonella aeria TaxID=1837929 RepID=A0A6I4TF00_9SPHN|nr:hypothetical protein [Tsuneonella aeria]MXO75653.1 hypothetical protein [Tsuneonella aeria]